MEQLEQLLGTFIAFRTTVDRRDEKDNCLQWIEHTFLRFSHLPAIIGEVGDSPYLLIRHGDPKLFWFGHVDVVPAMDAQFSLRIEGDLALGRGAKDMKGATLAFLIAYKEICESGSVPPVSILITTDEEVGGATPPALLATELLGHIPVAFTPDNGERDGIVTDMKGAAWIRLRANGKGGHGSVPWKSQNPVPVLCETLLNLQKKFPVGSEEKWEMSVTPTQLSASMASNMIPEFAEAVLDIRFPAETGSSGQVLSLISAHLPGGVTAELKEGAVPLHTDENHPMIQTYRSIASSVAGRDVPVIRECGSSDARAFGAKGIPAFLHGPVGGNLHGAKEWVSLTSLREQVEINRRWLQALSAQQVQS